MHAGYLRLSKAESIERNERAFPDRSTRAPRTSSCVALVFFVVVDIVLVALNSFNAYVLTSVSRESTSHTSETDNGVNKFTYLSHLFAYSLTAGASAALHAAVGIIAICTAGKPLTIYKWSHFGLAVVLIAAGPCIAIEALLLGRGFYIGFGKHNTLYFQVLYYGSFAQSLYGSAGVALAAIAFGKSAFS